MSMNIARLYLRASTDDQDATRALDTLKSFAATHDLYVASVYAENISGTSEQRPELDRLLDEAAEGDILLIESTDRLTRLPFNAWQRLKARLTGKGLRLVIVDAPTSHMNLTRHDVDSPTFAILHAINTMLIDILASMAREDYTKRRTRQAQGIAKAQAEGKYKGRQIDEDKHQRIGMALDQGMSQRAVAELLGVSLTTVNKVAKIKKGA